MGLASWLEDIAVKHEGDKAATGGFGNLVKGAYWALAGRKTKIGAALEVVTLALNKLGYLGAYGDTLQAVAHVLEIIGLLDAAWRSNTIAIPDEWKRFYARAVQLAPITGLLVSAALQWADAQFCAPAACPQWLTIIQHTAMVASGLGLIGVVNLAHGPALTAAVIPIAVASTKKAG